jgi:ABC-type Fe3+ transport system permease subunit
LTIANDPLNRRFSIAAGGRLAGWLKPSNFVLVGCVLVALWLVFVPVSALFYNAFTEDTGFGPGAFSLQNFVDAYSDWQILALFRNSLVFALGTALTTFALGGLVSWAVERTDAPGAALFHSLALLSFAIPGLLMAMAWIFVLSPNIGWANALMKNGLGLAQAPLNIYSMPGMIWALSSHYFPLAYLSLGPALRVLDVRMEEAGVVSGGRNWQVLTRITLPLLRPAILVATIINVINVFNSFPIIWEMTRGGPGYETSTTTTFMFILKQSFIGEAAAMSVANFVLVIAVVLVFLKVTRWKEQIT